MFDFIGHRSDCDRLCCFANGTLVFAFYLSLSCDPFVATDLNQFLFSCFILITSFAFCILRILIIIIKKNCFFSHIAIDCFDFANEPVCERNVFSVYVTFVTTFADFVTAISIAIVSIAGQQLDTASITNIGSAVLSTSWINELVWYDATESTKSITTTEQTIERGIIATRSFIVGQSKLWKLFKSKLSTIRAIPATKYHLESITRNFGSSGCWKSFTCSQWAPSS